MFTRSFAAAILVILVSMAIDAQGTQKADVTISLNEPFFDALLDSMFQNFDPPQFSLAKEVGNHGNAEPQTAISNDHGPGAMSFSDGSARQPFSVDPPFCAETVKLLPEMKGVRTAVRFREGKIYVPIAFSGNYEPPIIGCIDFAGWAESTIDLQFDQETQRLIGRIRVLNVNLNGTGGVGGSIIAKLIQGSIDKKLNPLEIVRLDKISFGVPIQNVGTLNMKAVAVRPEVVNSSLNVVVTYQFSKS